MEFGIYRLVDHTFVYVIQHTLRIRSEKTALKTSNPFFDIMHELTTAFPKRRFEEVKMLTVTSFVTMANRLIVQCAKVVKNVFFKLSL